MNLLVKNDSDIRRFTNNLNNTFRQDFVAGELQHIQSGYLSRVFGVAFITALADRHNAATPSPVITTEERTLMDLLGVACANLAIAQALPTLVVQLGNAGLFQIEGSGTKSVFQWQKIDYENSLLESGYQPVDAALQYLWLNRNHTQFSLWKDSASEKASLEYCVNTAYEAQESYPIGSSRRTYEALRPFIREAEMFNVQPIVGADLYNRIKTKRIAFDLSDKEKEVNRLMRDVVMQDAIAKSIGRLTVKVDSEGFRVISVAGTGSDSFKNKNTASGEQLDMLRKEANAATSRYANLLCNYLLTNLADFEEFKQSNTYKQQETPTSINTTESRTFAF